MNLDDVNTKLRSLGYRGNRVQKQLAYLRDWGYTGTLNQMWYDYLGDLGYTGSLIARRNAFTDVDELTAAPDPEAPPPTGPVAFSSGFSSGFH